MKEELKLLGLNEIEIKVFLSSLELGEAPASLIAKKSKVPRASIYDILNRLSEKGLMSNTVKDYKKHFKASEPKTIIKNLEYKKQKIKEILPNLESLKNKNSHGIPLSQVYSGRDGLKTIFNLMLEEKEIFGLGLSRKSHEVLPYFLPNWLRERAKRKIKMKVLYNDTKEIRDSVKSAEKYLHSKINWESKYLKTGYLSNITTAVFGDNLVFLNLNKDNPSAILIKDSAMTNTYKEYILNLWKIAKV